MRALCFKLPCNNKDCYDKSTKSAHYNKQRINLESSRALESMGIEQMRCDKIHCMEKPHGTEKWHICSKAYQVHTPWLENTKRTDKNINRLNNLLLLC